MSDTSVHDLTLMVLQVICFGGAYMVFKAKEVFWRAMGLWMALYPLLLTLWSIYKILEKQT